MKIAGAEARGFIGVFSARLKSCPVTKRLVGLEISKATGVGELV